MILLIYLALIAAPCAVAFLVYAIVCKARKIYRINRSPESRIEKNRAEYRTGWKKAEKHELRA